MVEKSSSDATALSWPVLTTTLLKGLAQLNSLHTYEPIVQKPQESLHSAAHVLTHVTLPIGAWYDRS